jgi:hypothetical protein
MANIKESEESERSSFTPPKIKIVVESPMKVSSMVKTPKKKGNETPKGFTKEKNLMVKIEEKGDKSLPEGNAPLGKDNKNLSTSPVGKDNKSLSNTPTMGKNQSLPDLKNLKEKIREENNENYLPKENNGGKEEKSISRFEEEIRLSSSERIKEEERGSFVKNTEPLEERGGMEEENERRRTEIQNEKGSPDVYRFESARGQEEEEINDFDGETNKQRGK